MDNKVQEHEDANTAACRRTALNEGHTVTQADNCDDFSVGCKRCPFKFGAQQPQVRRAT